LVEAQVSWLLWAGSLAMGAVVGSFLNVCIYRLPRQESLVYPGSHCPSCGSPIRPYDNIPILSYLLLRGRCRVCAGRISPRYPFVEALTAGLALALAGRYGWSPETPIFFVLSSALIVITFIDLDHQIIPNSITYPGIPLGVAASFFLPEVSLKDSLLGLALGGGILWLVAVLFKWVRNKEGMGFGDVKLLAMIGAFLGWKAVLLTLVLSSFVGAVVGYAALRLSGKDAGEPIPFGPFLAMGAVVYMLGGDELVNWYLALGRAS
jgi:leader peptidase (prepilin peptidase)/N-methyltransferase